MKSWNPQIQNSQDYSLFKMMKGNRPLNKRKIEKIKDDISHGLNLLPYCPVIVFEKDSQLHIVDGQHRYTAAMELELPVYYIKSAELNLFQIATMNSKQDKWTEQDFLKCYIEIGSPDYKVLKEVSHENQFSIAVTAELLMHGTYVRRKDMIDVFREGNFKANFPDETKDMLQLVVSLFGRYKFYSDRSLVQAVQMIKNKGMCDFDFLKEKVKQAPMLMDKQTSAKEYIYNIERVYNHKASIRKVIF